MSLHGSAMYLSLSVVEGSGGFSLFSGGNEMNTNEGKLDESRNGKTFFKEKSIGIN
jgi:hypothetical protein